MTPTAVAKRLYTVLAEEREALRTGQFDALAGMADEKLQLLDRLASTPCSPEILAGLRDGLMRNARLAEASALGVRDAMNRLQEIKKASGPINGYSCDGRAQSIGPGQSTRDIKA